jgi:tRNA-binding EMAP/Myf-like protein
MKYSFNWLKELSGTKMTAEKAAELLTMRSLEIDGVEKAGSVPNSVIVGKILEIKKHPNADKLQLVRVDVGTGRDLSAKTWINKMFMTFQEIILKLQELGVKLNLPEAILIHSGGWKKLELLAVKPEQFRNTVEEVIGTKKCFNFYGMVEQTGSIYFENELHYLNASIYSDIIIRDPITLKVLPIGEIGLIQVMSLLPTSYPGHSILTEDLGLIHGVDSPKTQMKGKFFEVIGRVPQAEARGCSDTFQTISKV